MAKILILPFSLKDAEKEADVQFLTRQLPVLVRNAFERFVPGVVVAAPFATTVDGKRAWVVQSRSWSDDTALSFAAEKGYAYVAMGDLASGSTRGIRSLRFRLLDAIHAVSVVDKDFTGDVLALGRAVAAALAPYAGVDAAEGAVFEPGTTAAIAYEHYMRGLDVLLTLRSPQMELKEPERALEPFVAAVEADPAFGDALTAGLSCALQVMEPEGKEIPLEAAVNAVWGWIARFPGDPRIHAVGAELLIWKQRLPEALAVLAHGLKNVQPPPRELLRRSGDVLVDLKRNAEALEVYRQCETMQHDRLVLERMATLATMLEKFDEAAVFLETLVETQKDRPDLLARLGMVLVKLERVDDGWKRLAQAFDTTVGPGEAELSKMTAVLAQHRPSEAFKNALRSWHPPTNFSADNRVSLARALRLSGARMEAKLCLDSIERRSLTPEVRSTLARETLNLRRPDFDQAFAVVAKAVMAGEIDDRMKLLDEAVLQEPDFWPARFLLGLGRAKSGDLQKASEDLGVVLAMQPKNDIVWYTRGLYLLRLGRPGEAVEHFERAIGLNAKEGDYHIHLALTHAQMRHGEKARATLARAIELRPNHPENSKWVDEIEKALQ